MQKLDNYDRRQNRGFDAASADDIDLNQREDQRRRTARLALRLWTEGRCEGKLDFHNCSNICETGMFIETPEPYPLAASVQIEFNLPGVPEPIRTMGRVVSVLDESNAGTAIMGNGFVFEQIATADQELIRAYVEASYLASNWSKT